ncbi:thioredoxin reductase (NADPH) [Pontibacter ummariensis]|uniref:Thioredoxin reductase n=1 Tax=Pontibacter ummariensis TaxID=1610492 RepID=A0A239KR98_9BACT|nr:thioredoxin-disulfide reductase [Pontibacter ummariensis]PRY05000.1 thioredoxin reductase (NADPH) [Pontibacter ummariensis]SNT20917.1 thioredoxin reductase (NADPH) [Pontibacter ummariensis]
METEKVKVLIIGSGPAGYTAAIYASRAGLQPVLYQGLQPGGQLTITNDVENYPGYPEGINGPQMMEDFRRQAERFGTDVRYGVATAVDFSSKPHKVTIDDQKVIEAETVIISTGASAKWLGLESEARLNGSGVSACAVCDGFFYRGQDVAIVGAGDTAAEEATYLANLASKVYMIVRRDEMRASVIMQERVKRTKNIEILWNSVTEEILGDQAVEGVRVRNVVANETREIPVKGFFVAIGHKPNSDIFKDYLNLDGNGYIRTIPGTSKTNIDGVFACGDVQDFTYRQAVTAAGSGCMAALDAERYLASLESGPAMEQEQDAALSLPEKA